MDASQRAREEGSEQGRRPTHLAAARADPQDHRELCEVRPVESRRATLGKERSEGAKREEEEESGAKEVRGEVCLEKIRGSLRPSTAPPP